MYKSNILIIYRRKAGNGEEPIIQTYEWKFSKTYERYQFIGSWVQWALKQKKCTHVCACIHK